MVNTKKNIVHNMAQVRADAARERGGARKGERERERERERESERREAYTACRRARAHCNSLKHNPVLFSQVPKKCTAPADLDLSLFYILKSEEFSLCLIHILCRTYKYVILSILLTKATPCLSGGLHPLAFIQTRASQLSDGLHPVWGGYD